MLPALQYTALVAIVLATAVTLDASKKPNSNLPPSDKPFEFPPPPNLPSSKKPFEFPPPPLQVLSTTVDKKSSGMPSSPQLPPPLITGPSKGTEVKAPPLRPPRPDLPPLPKELQSGRPSPLTTVESKELSTSSSLNESPRLVEKKEGQSSSPKPTLKKKTSENIILSSSDSSMECIKLPFDGNVDEETKRLLDIRDSAACVATYNPALLVDTFVQDYVRVMEKTGGQRIETKLEFMFSDDKPTPIRDSVRLHLVGNNPLHTFTDPIPTYMYASMYSAIDEFLKASAEDIDWHMGIARMFLAVHDSRDDGKGGVLVGAVYKEYFMDALYGRLRRAKVRALKERPGSASEVQANLVAVLARDLLDRFKEVTNSPVQHPIPWPVPLDMAKDRFNLYVHEANKLVRAPLVVLLALLQMMVQDPLLTTIFECVYAATEGKPDVSYYEALWSVLMKLGADFNKQEAVAKAIGHLQGIYEYHVVKLSEISPKTSTAMTPVTPGKQIGNTKRL